MVQSITATHRTRRRTSTLLDRLSRASTASEAYGLQNRIANAMGLFEKFLSLLIKGSRKTLAEPRDLQTRPADVRWDGAVLASKEQSSSLEARKGSQMRWQSLA